MIRLFEMFAGYGGASFGLRKASIEFESIGYSEIDKYAIQCYEQNHQSKNYGDCSKINVEDLPDFDLWTGRFTCQDVSIAGKRDLNKGRTNLYLEVLRIANAKKPKYIVLENVKGLLSMETDEVKLVDKIIRDLQGIGYGVVWKVLNSSDYGIPQNRERVWFVCKLGGGDFMEFMFPLEEKLKIFLKDLLEEGIVDRDTSYCIDANYFKGNNLKGYVEKCRRQLVFDKDIIVPNSTKLGYQMAKPGDGIRLDNPKSLTGRGRCIKKLSNTLLTQGMQGVNDSGMIRKLTPKECFRLMGFKDGEINLDGLSNNQKYRLAGNGWDINLVSKIFTSLNLNEVKE